MNHETKHIVEDFFGKKYEFDYTNATHFGLEIISKNAKVIIYVEHNEKEKANFSTLLTSIRNDLGLEWPIFNQYIPSGKRFVIDIYQKEEEEEKKS